MSRPRTLRAAQEYEADLRAGIAAVADAEAHQNHTVDYINCPRGPRCAWPIHCCPECYRHSRLKHDCGGI